MNLQATACIQTIRYSCLLGDNHFIANVTDKDHKIIKIHYFVAKYKHPNVTFNIQMLLNSKIRSNVEHSLMHYCVQYMMATI